MRNHAFDSMFNQQLRPPLTAIRCCLRLMATYIARKAHETLLSLFFAGQAYLLRIDHNHEIARINMGRENRLAFPTQKICDLDSDTTQGLVFRVNDIPFSLDLPRFG